MNRKQRIAIGVGALVIAGAALFPPFYWECTRLPEKAVPSSRDAPMAGVPGLTWHGTSIGHMSVFGSSLQHKAMRGFEATPRIDFDRVVLYVGTILILTVAAVLVLKDGKGARRPTSHVA